MVERVRGPDTAVLVSFFSSGRMGVMQHCYIFTDGEQGMVRFVNDWAIQGGGPGAAAPGVSMPDAQRSALDAAIGRLPASQAFAHDADAFYVSWDDKGKWNTRTYDRTKLPLAVLEFCKLVNIPESWF
jgi:hypothetical protein